MLELVALIKAHGIREVVLSPGSRNAPLSLSFAADPFFRCHSIVDERSAGYVALGMIQASRQPVVVCCTSGSALLNYGPAVAEAFYQKLPLIVVSADRTEAWIGQMDGQTIPQYQVFGALVKRSVHIPEVHSDEDLWHANRLINEALNAALMAGGGPVHLNMPIDEPLSDFSVQQLPEVRKITMIHPTEADADGAALLASAMVKAKRPMLVVGQRLPASDNLSELLEILSLRFGVVVLAEHLANVDHAIASFDAILEHNKMEAPDLLITLGGHVVSKRLKQLLRAQKPDQHILFSDDLEAPDTYQALTCVLRQNPVAVLKKTIEVLLQKAAYNNISFSGLGSYYSQWTQAASALSFDSENMRQNYCEHLPFSDLYAVGKFLELLPENASILVANSSSVRHVQAFPLPKNTRVYCNRGTNGIEGTLSTAFGMALVSDRPLYVILGDLAFFYDLNILTVKPFPKNLKVLLLNNGGGGIFDLLYEKQPKEAYQSFVAAEHTTQAVAWANAAGLEVVQANDKASIQAGLKRFMAFDENSILLEVNNIENNAKEAQQKYAEIIQEHK